ncbi:MAG: hypothetical protein K2W95_35075 [Candidatus Obscuribacterales bacterium]|nr:hypothetical protein [Candidatus Obscuribacterales bacterium]
MKTKSQSLERATQTVKITRVVETKTVTKVERKDRPAGKDHCSSGVCAVSWKPRSEK